MSESGVTDGKPIKSVIYCRVSGKTQTVEGSGLGSQEYRCRQYAAAKGYEVEEVFPDDVSGGGDFMNRPGMVALLRYLDERPHEDYVVIFDDLKRYARDVEFHLKLRRIMQERNATRECLNFNFEDSPEGKFNEIISAAAGELERLQMARQNRQKSIARVEQGYAVHNQPPIGYKFVQSPRGGKVLVKDEPYASIIKEALEGYATDRFASQVEVKRFLDSHPQFPKSKTGEVRQQKIVKILRQKMYAGLIDAPAWGVSVRKAKHEALVSIEVFERIQAKLDGGVYAPTRKDIREDFPLRGAVCCAGCQTPLTAGWSKGKCKRYPYYFCRKKGCAQYGKAIARDRIEGEFTSLLGRLQPTESLARIAAAMFKDCWNAQLEQAAALVESAMRDIQSIEVKIGQMVDRIVDTTNPRVVAALEKRIEELERQKLVVGEKAKETGAPRRPFNEVFEHSIRFLSSPYKLWDSGRFELQRLVLKLTFAGHLEYCRNEGFRTPKTTLPFSMLGEIRAGKGRLVPPGGIEPPTPPLPRVCSTPELRRHHWLSGGESATGAAPRQYLVAGAAPALPGQGEQRVRGRPRPPNPLP